MNTIKILFILLMSIYSIESNVYAASTYTYTYRFDVPYNTNWAPCTSGCQEPYGTGIPFGIGAHVDLTFDNEQKTTANQTYTLSQLVKATVTGISGYYYGTYLNATYQNTFTYVDTANSSNLQSNYVVLNTDATGNNANLIFQAPFQNGSYLPGESLLLGDANHANGWSSWLWILDAGSFGYVGFNFSEQIFDSQGNLVNYQQPAYALSVSSSTSGPSTYTISGTYIGSSESTVPIPSAIWLFLSSLVGLGFFGKHRKSS